MQINKLPQNQLINFRQDSQLDQSKQSDQDHFYQDVEQIDEIMRAIKTMYFKKREYIVQVMKQMVLQNRIKTNKLNQLQLPPTIQIQRERQFIKQGTQDNFGQNNIQSSQLFRKKIIQSYKIKQAVHKKVNDQKQQLEDSTNKQIKKIYQKKFGNYHYMNPFGSFMQDLEEEQQKSNQSLTHSTENKLVSMRINQNLNRKRSKNKKQIQTYSKKLIKLKDSNKSSKASIEVIDSSPQPISATHRETYNTSVSADKAQSEFNRKSLKNINQNHPQFKKDYMKIQDPNIGLQTSVVSRGQNELQIAKNRMQQIDDSFQNQSTHTKNQRKSERQHQKQKTNKSIAFSQKDSGYKNFIQRQTEQLSKQKKRAQQLAAEATKALNFQEQDNHTPEQDHSQNNFKNMLNQIIELFIISETIKFQLRFRGFQILSKLYKQAEKYYNQKIQIKEPIESKIFQIVLKPFLAEYLKSQIDIVINSIFVGKTQISFDQFVTSFTPILNQKEVLLLNDGSNTKQIQMTVQKTKKLFITLIQIKYFATKIKELLKNNRQICQKFIGQTLFPEQQQYFDSALIEQYLTNHRKNNFKKMKIQIFFTHFIDKQMRKKTFLQWISRIQNHYFYQKKDYIN